MVITLSKTACFLIGFVLGVIVLSVANWLVMPVIKRITFKKAVKAVV